MYALVLRANLAASEATTDSGAAAVVVVAAAASCLRRDVDGGRMWGLRLTLFLVKQVRGEKLGGAAG